MKKTEEKQQQKNITLDQRLEMNEDRKKAPATEYNREKRSSKHMYG